MYWLIFFMLLSTKSLTSACPSECRCFGFNESWIADCSRRNFSSIPRGYTSNTTEIFLQYNNIKAIKENDFGKLYKLKILHLHSNSISTVHENAFKEMSDSLEYLTLSGNQIDELSSSTFAGMMSLKVLNLNNNRLTLIQENLFSDMKNVVQLSACNNSIDTVHKNVFVNLTNLRYVGVSHNNITFIPPNLGEEASELYVLDYADNNINELPQLPSTLKQIYLSGNDITKITFNALRNATNLYELFVQGNKIDSIEDGAFKNSQTIGWLDLSKNNLSKAETNTFAFLKNLVGLNLTENPQLNSISKDAFGHFKTTLRRLSFDKCSIAKMDPKTTSHLQNDDLYIWAGSNPWNCDCDLEEFSNYVDSKSRMFYDIETMLCQTPQNLAGKRIDNVTHAELLSACEGTKTSLLNETALIISLSAVGAFLGIAAFVFAFLKLKKKNRTFGSNETIVTESSQ